MLHSRTALAAVVLTCELLRKLAVSVRLGVRVCMYEISLRFVSSAVQSAIES